MKTWIGTSGFQYPEWKGSFYPEDLAAAKMLPYFAERLSTTEINYTFHRIPSPKTIDNWLAQTPENFRFALKAPQKITHFAKLRDCQDTMAYFYRVVSALGDRLGPVLFQLPPNFKKNADVLSAFLRELPAMRAALVTLPPLMFTEPLVHRVQRLAEAVLAGADVVLTGVVGAVRQPDLQVLRARRMHDLNAVQVVRDRPAPHSLVG